MKIENVTVRLNMKVGLEVERTVPNWEANLLVAIHGEDKVLEVARLSGEAEFDAKETWEALLRKYGSATNEEGKQIVRLVYPSQRALERWIDDHQPSPAANRKAA